MAIHGMNRRAFIAALGIGLSVFLYLGAAAQDGYHGAGHDRWHQDFYAKLRSGFVLRARVGGLLDTIIDANEMALAARCATGIQFAPVDAEALKIALQRAAELFSDRSTWIRMQRNGMATDVSWRKPAQRYATLYRELVSEPRDLRVGAKRRRQY